MDKLREKLTKEEVIKKSKELLKKFEEVKIKKYGRQND